MKALVRDFHELKEVIKAVKVNLEDISLNFDNQKINMAQADRSLVSFIDLTVKASYFDEYEFPEKKTITLNAERFSKVLDKLDKNSKIWLEIKDNNLVITEFSDFKVDHTIPLLENPTSQENPDIHNMKWITEFTLKTEIFKKIIDKFKDASSITISTTDNINFFNDNTSDFNSQAVVFQNDDALIDYNKQPSKSRFSIEYLEKLIKFANPKIFENVKIYLSTDFPLKMEFINDNIIAKVLLAPRVEE